MIEEGLFSKPDQFREMHKILTKHGYTTSDHKTYTHPDGQRAHLRTSALYHDALKKDLILPKGKTTHKIDNPIVHHSHSSVRFLHSKDLNHHLKKIHEDAPTNAMAGSSSSSGPINTYDPMLKVKSKRNKPDSYSVFRRKAQGEKIVDGK
jgi:hypothetical protein